MAEKRKYHELIGKKLWTWFLNGINPFHNFSLKLISFVLAVIAMYLVGGQQQVREVDVPIYLTLPAEFASSQSFQNTATVRLLASSAILNSLQPGQILFDFKDVSFQKGEIFINLENRLKTPPGIEVLSIEPDSLRLILEEKIQKHMPIKVRLEGRPQRNFEYINYNITPPKVIIEGPRSIVSRITEIQTEPISLANRYQTFTTEVPLTLHDSRIKILERSSILLTVTIVERPHTISIDRLEIEIKSPPAKYLYNPRIVSISFYCGKEMKNIDKKDVIIEADLSGFTTLNKELKVPLKVNITNREITENCRIKKLSQDWIDLFITKLE
jgi:YbbR domain-containing protein